MRSRPAPARALPPVGAVLLAAASVPLVLLDAALSYGLRSLTAVLAVALLLRGAADDPRLRRSRRLVALALALGVTSGFTALGQLLVTGEPAPLGGPADALYLLYVPAALAALVSMTARRDAGELLRGLADAAVAASALALLVLSLLEGPGTTGWARVAALVYPLSAVFVLAVLLSVLPRAHRGLHPFLPGVAAGLALLAASDLLYSVAASRGWYAPTAWPAALHQLALAVMALAALPVRRAPLSARRPRRSLLGETAPYLPLVPCALAAVVLWQRDQGLAPAQLLPLAVLAVALVARHVLATVQQRRSLAALGAREREARRAGRRDPLTGLSNRQGLSEVLSAALADGTAPVGLLLIDLDDFKDVNDRHGHDTGDEVLRQVAARLRAATPAGGIVARLGGDEFALCVPGCADGRALGEQVAAGLGAPVRVGERVFAVGCSIGAVLCAPGDAGGPADALAHADVAMYEAKAGKGSGRSRVVLLTGPDRARAAARVRLRDEVAHPDLRQFRLVYQPVLDLRDGALVGAEALLRWQHPELGDVPPDVFVPLAEQVGGIDVLGEHVLHTALAAFAGWVREATAEGGPVRGAVGVNVSSRQLDRPDLPERVAAALAEHGLAPHRLVLEITESALVQDWDTAVDVVSRLRGLGVAVAVDDFGTGYSSLSYLRRFETSTIKVDQEFVHGLADGPRHRALVRSVVAMAEQLDLYTVGEGVETVEQARALCEEGCRYAQGQLFDPPLEAEAFGRLLVGRHAYALPWLEPVVLTHD